MTPNSPYHEYSKVNPETHTPNMSVLTLVSNERKWKKISHTISLFIVVFSEQVNKGGFHTQIQNSDDELTLSPSEPFCTPKFSF